jgi:hypothetical protein
MRSVHAKLDDELDKELAALEARTRLSAADLMRQGLMRVAKEVKTFGKLEILTDVCAEEPA